MSDRFGGIVSPILTPFEADGEVAHDLYASHARWSLEAGVHYISPFGTTGEAASVGVAERIDMLQFLVGNGIDPASMMPGTGVTALSDTVTLTSVAVDMGCAAAMVLPPFYYPATDEGLYRYYSRLVEKVADDRLRICLYHIPQMTGVPIGADVTARLSAAFPGIIAAYKDSSGDWANTEAVIAAAPNVSVFPGSELGLIPGKARGAAGCISATCNSNARQIREYWNAVQVGDDAARSELEPKMVLHRETVAKAGFIPALKSMMADRTGETRWLNIRPPSDDAPAETGKELNSVLDWTL